MFLQYSLYLSVAGHRGDECYRGSRAGQRGLNWQRSSGGWCYSSAVQGGYICKGVSSNLLQGGKDVVRTLLNKAVSQVKGTLKGLSFTRYLVCIQGKAFGFHDLSLSWACWVQVTPAGRLPPAVTCIFIRVPRLSRPLRDQGTALAVTEL